MSIIVRDRFSVFKVQYRVQNLAIYGLSASVCLFVHSFHTAPKAPEQIS